MGSFFWNVGDFVGFFFSRKIKFTISIVISAKINISETKRRKDFLPWSLETIFKTIQLKTVLRPFYIIIGCYF